MALPPLISRFILFALIFLSGCAGLIYEVVWQRYLAILLGAQARATAIILAIFLGGIALGYAVFGRWSRWKSWNLLKVYALVELLLGLWAFCFPYLFALMLPLTAKLYASWGLTNLGTDFVVALILVAVPTFLMGGTLPLLTQGLSEDLTKASQTHAKIYGFNTLGACFGCLLAGYVLLPAYSFSAVTRVGALLNFVVAAVVYFGYARQGDWQIVAPTDRAASRGPWFSFTPTQWILLGIGFLSGFYTLTLETCLIRLMGLSTGASNYNFTLIVAIFILGLGVGSLLVRGISHYTVSRLFWNQVCLAVALGALYFSGDYWSYGVHLIRITLRDIPENFFFYQFLLGAAFTLVLIVPIGFAGLTLPLCFHLIKDTREALGHRVGQLYGINTLGCVLGAICGGYFLLNYLDLDQLIKLCLFMGLVTCAGAAYLYIPAYRPGNVQLSLTGTLGFALLGVLLFAPRYHHDRWCQPFRHAEPISATFEGADAFGKYLGRSTEFLYWKDGPNTSVGIGSSKIDGKELSRTIFVNGKSDGNTRGDLFTTIMLGHIAGLLSYAPEHIGIIGFGTGMTIGTLALYDEVKSIDVADISGTILENAKYFDPYNGEVSTNQKVHFHEMDAFRYFQGTEQKFDVIVSEPSNPWVAGIENLYSAEFYDMARRKLTENGVFVQWIHTYSFTNDLLRMVLRTISNHLPNVSVWQLKGGDLALVSTMQPLNREDLVRANKRFQDNIIARTMMSSAGINRFEAVLALEIVPPSVVRPMAEGAEEHHLQSPKLSNEAAKAFFAGSSAGLQSLRRSYKEFYPSIESSLLAVYMGKETPGPALIESFRDTFCDNTFSKNNSLCEETLAMAKFLNPKLDLDPKYDDVIAKRELSSLTVLGEALNTPVGSAPFNASQLQDVYSMFEMYKKFASPIARISPSHFMTKVEYCLKTVPYAAELYGECLLQKILVLETASMPSPDFQKLVDVYLDWFPNLAQGTTNYTKLKDARDILAKMTSPSSSTKQ